MTVETTPDKRHFHRIFYHGKASLTTATAIYPCEIIDLSLKGCLLKFEQPWDENLESTANLELRLSDEISIKMELSVAHWVNNEVGFKCEHIDIDSISQLRRLVELNLGNSQLLERDIQALSANIA